MTRAIVTIGLGFGDEGKGAVVDFLVREHKADLVVRYSGGCQAGHNVVIPDGRWHTFSQFGAGTFAGVRTWLHKNMIVDPFAMVREATHLKEVGIAEPFEWLSVHPKCLVTTPFHRDANRFRELQRGEYRHGSCGMGIGECRSYAIDNPVGAVRVEDLRNHKTLVKKLEDLHGHLLGELGSEFTNETAKAVATRYATVVGILRTDDHPPFSMAVFEGSQGIMLDETVGLHPYTTWSDVTLNAAREALYDLRIDDYSTLGITRCFATRHGAGPLPTEMRGVGLDGDHNKCNDWQGGFRVGRFDNDVFAYACQNAGGKLDGLAVTWLDRQPRGCEVNEAEFIETMQSFAPVALVSRGPTWRDKRQV